MKVLKLSLIALFAASACLRTEVVDHALVDGLSDKEFDYVLNYISPNEAVGNLHNVINILQEKYPQASSEQQRKLTSAFHNTYLVDDDVYDHEFPGRFLVDENFLPGMREGYWTVGNAARSFMEKIGMDDHIIFSEEPVPANIEEENESDLILDPSVSPVGSENEVVAEPDSEAEAAPVVVDDSRKEDVAKEVKEQELLDELERDMESYEPEISKDDEARETLDEVSESKSVLPIREVVDEKLIQQETRDLEKAVVEAKVAEEVIEARRVLDLALRDYYLDESKSKREIDSNVERLIDKYRDVLSKDDQGKYRGILLSKKGHRLSDEMNRINDEIYLGKYDKSYNLDDMESRVKQFEKEAEQYARKNYTKHYYQYLHNDGKNPKIVFVENDDNYLKPLVREIRKGLRNIKKELKKPRSSKTVQLKTKSSKPKLEDSEDSDLIFDPSVPFVDSEIEVEGVEEPKDSEKKGTERRKKRSEKNSETKGEKNIKVEPKEPVVVDDSKKEEEAKPEPKVKQEDESDIIFDPSVPLVYSEVEVVAEPDSEEEAQSEPKMEEGVSSNVEPEKKPEVKTAPVVVDDSKKVTSKSVIVDPKTGKIIEKGTSKSILIDPHTGQIIKK